MKKPYVTLVNKQFSKRQSLFLKDPKSDLFVIINEKVYPLHRSFLTQVGQFSNEEQRPGKIHILSESIEPTHFQLIISYFYGKELKLGRDWSIGKLMQSIRLLTVPILQKLILNDMKANFDDYGFFLLVSIAHKFHVKWLKQKCEQQLILMGFEQLNYNRYDLLQVDKETLQQILKLHQILKQNQNILGLRYIQLKKIINQYCKVNNVQIQIQNIINSSQTINSKLDDQDQPSFYNINVDNLPKNTTKIQQVQDKNKSTDTSFNTQSSGIGSDDKQQQLQRLRIINKQMYQQNNKLIAQLENVRIICNSPAFSNHDDDIDGIDQNFSKFQKICQQQQQKFLCIKTQVQKLHPNKFKNNFYCAEEKGKTGQLEASDSLSDDQSLELPMPKIIGKKQNIKLSTMSVIPKLDRELDD